MAIAAPSAAAGMPAPPPGFHMVTEGQASVFFPVKGEGGKRGERGGDGEGEGGGGGASGQRPEVFYNKVQVVNRDMSVQVLRYFVQKRAAERLEERRRKEERRKRREEREAAEAVGGAAGDAASASAATAAAAAGAGAAATENAAEPVRKTLIPFDELEEEDHVTVLDALAASALRSIRYVKEVPGIRRVVANDLSEDAVRAASRNAEANQVDPEKLVTNHGDATLVMYQHRGAAEGEQFDVIDLDPYGSAAPFLDAAVQCISDGGLLCVTCTDMTVLCGNNVSVNMSRYGSLPIKGPYFQEFALRTVLNSIETHANRYGRYIVPMLSMSVDFYLRVFVRVHTAPRQVAQSPARRGYILQSSGCSTYFVQPMARSGSGEHKFLPAHLPDSGTCPDTGSHLKIGGPIWTDPLHNAEDVTELLRRVSSGDTGFPMQSAKRLEGLLTVMSEELPDVPLYYTVPDLARTLHCGQPRREEIEAALYHAGYRTSSFHHEPNAIKTDAPSSVVWDVMRCWLRVHPPPKKKQKNKNRNQNRAQDVRQSAAEILLAKEPQLEANFSVPYAIRNARRQFKGRVARFPDNPEPHWGPKRSAAIGGTKRKLDEEDNGTAEDVAASASDPASASGAGSAATAAAAVAAAAPEAAVADGEEKQEG